MGGADRLLLSEHIAFQDLLALGRFARFPDDDLTLAALLRSPFCDVDEDGLYDLAYEPRTGRCGPRCRRGAGRAARWGEARAASLPGRGARPRRAPPFDFYARVLTPARRARAARCSARFLTRLGREAEDAIDAFLAQALAAERRGVVDLERFVAEMAASEIEVKREQEDGAAARCG